MKILNKYIMFDKDKKPIAYYVNVLFDNNTTIEFKFKQELGDKQCLQYAAEYADAIKEFVQEDPVEQRIKQAVDSAVLEVTKSFNVRIAALAEEAKQPVENVKNGN